MADLASRPMGVDYFTGSPSPVRDVGYSIIGKKGSTIYFYWVIANYSWGSVPPRAPLMVTNAPDVLSATNAVSLSWLSPSPQIVSYTVLRTTTNQFPGTSSNTAVVINTLNQFEIDTGFPPLASVTISPIPAMRAVVYLDGTGPVPILVSTVGQQVAGDLTVSGDINLISGSAFPGGSATIGSITTPDGGTLPFWHTYTVELVPPNWVITSADNPSPVLIPTAAALTQDLILTTLPPRTYVEFIRGLVITGPSTSGTINVAGIGNVTDGITNPDGSDSFWVTQNFNVSQPPGPIGFSDFPMAAQGNTTVEACQLSITMSTILSAVLMNALVPPVKFSISVLWGTTPLQ